MQYADKNSLTKLRWLVSSAGMRGRLGVADMGLEAARKAGAKTLVIDLANRGGIISASWKEILLEVSPLKR